MDPAAAQLHDLVNEALGELLALQNRIPDDDGPPGYETARHSLERATKKLTAALDLPMFEEGG
jgi:hypothetical protein